MVAVVQTIILNWRTAGLTLRAIGAAQREMKQLNGGITVVDNDSQDGSFERLRDAAEILPSVTVLQAGRNGGFGAGNNHAIRAGLPGGNRPDYVYVLNSDAFPGPDAIKILAEYLDRHPKVGFVGSYIHGEDDTPHLTTFRFPSIWSELEGAARFGPISRALAKYAVPREIIVPPPPPIPGLDKGPVTGIKVDWLAGASLMMRRDVLDDIGLFDENFFLYFEETDLSLRAARAGYETHFVGASRVAHIGSVSTGMKQWHRVPGYWFDSRLYYFSKNHGRLYAALATIAHLSGGLLHRARCLISRKKTGEARWYLWHLLTHDILAALKCIARLGRAKRPQRKD
ncbi:MAG: glycosyltransferase family 2 protein [Rhodobacteraceae bacterium]|nr:glycosyltransferase family 2 protein [Paracoccaceae bacterium]